MTVPEYKYTLDPSGQPVPCPDVIEWARWFESSDLQRVVAETTVGDVVVSTVFTGLARLVWQDDGPAILWETLVMGGPLDGEVRLYRSKAEAKLGHSAMVGRVTERTR